MRSPKQPKGANLSFSASAVFSPVTRKAAISPPDSSLFEKTVELSRIDPQLADDSHKGLSEPYYCIKRKNPVSGSLVHGVEYEQKMGAIHGFNHEFKLGEARLRVQKALEKCKKRKASHNTNKDDAIVLEEFSIYFEAQDKILGETLFRLPLAKKRKVEKHINQEIKKPSPKRPHHNAIIDKYHTEPGLIKTPTKGELTQRSLEIKGVMLKTQKEIEDIRNGKAQPPKKKKKVRKTLFQPLPASAQEVSPKHKKSVHGAPSASERETSAALDDSRSASSALLPAKDAWSISFLSPKKDKPKGDDSHSSLADLSALSSVPASPLAPPPLTPAHIDKAPKGSDLMTSPLPRQKISFGLKQPQKPPTNSIMGTDKRNVNRTSLFHSIHSRFESALSKIKDLPESSLAEHNSQIDERAKNSGIVLGMS